MDRIDTAGMFRCCIKTINELPPGERYENQRVLCTYCSEPLIFTQDAWRWAR